MYLPCLLRNKYIPFISLYTIFQQESNVFQVTTFLFCKVLILKVVVI